MFQVFKCFRDTLQVFHADVAKVDRDVAYVAMVVHYVANIDSQCFIYFFRRMLQVCLSEYCICFTHMLQEFCLNVAYVLQLFSGVFANVSETCFKCLICL